MVKYIYYDPVTWQVEAQFDTPVLSHQANWVGRGFLRAQVPLGMQVTPNHRIVLLDGQGYVEAVEDSPNPELLREFGS